MRRRFTLQPCLLRSSAALSLLVAGTLIAQTSAAPPAVETPDHLTSPRGQVIIQSHGEPPALNSVAPETPAVTGQPALPPEDAKADVSDAEREALLVTAYDLDARLNLARSGLLMRARLTIRNDGATALKHLPLQISSTLRWQSATLITASTRQPLALAQHRLDTDADHTGAVAEAVLTLPEPLGPGGSVSLDLFYEGAVAQSDARLTRLGASSSQGRQADWDAISALWTGLRGFGNVLWYPVASPQLFLSEGNTLFIGVGRMRQREQAASMRLRLSVEYTGEPPVAAYFCGRRLALKAVADDPTAPTASGSGIATADFAAEPLGFRTPNLFVLQQSEALIGGASGATASTSSLDSTQTSSATTESSSSSDANAEAATAARTGRVAATEGPVVALVSSDESIIPGLATAIDHASALLADWLGPRPLSAVTLLDHAGQPYQDGPLLVAPAATLETSPEAPALVYSLTHGWVQTGQPWMDEGLAQFFALLWVERDTGRGTALNQLQDLLQPVALAEPDFTSTSDTTPGQPLLSASDELFYRRKAAAVWWMLRDLAGEPALRTTLTAWRTQPVSHDTPEAQATAFEHLLEHESGKDLHWFFVDWVFRDRGLPDLSITGVETSPTSAGAGHNAGFLVAVTVRNEGAAVADVPLILRAGRFSTTQRIRISGFSQTTQRTLVETVPMEVQVNDGGTPELRSVVHTRQFVQGAPASP